MEGLGHGVHTCLAHRIAPEALRPLALRLGKDCEGAAVLRVRLLVDLEVKKRKADADASAFAFRATRNAAGPDGRPV